MPTHLVRFCVCIGLLSSSAAAQNYPSRPVRVVVPFAAGGVSDLVLQTISDPLSKALGQPVVMDNRGGGGGTVAASYVARATPDGHILMLGTGGNLAMAPSLYKTISYNPQTDFAPIAMVARGQLLLVLHPSVQAGSVLDLVRLAKARPGQLKYASSGIGSPLHLAAELFKSQAGVDILHVPYKGSSPMLNDLIGGHIELAFDSIATSLPHVQSNRLKGIAVTGEIRSPSLPGIPTVSESGVPNFRVTSFYALVAPATTPKAVVDRLEREVLFLAESEEVKRRLVSYGLDPVAIGAGQLEQVLRKERADWAVAIKTANIEPQ